MKINYNECITYEAYLTIGSIRGYNGITIDKNELISSISNFQLAFENEHGYSCGVRILKSKVVFQGYSEDCWDVHIINYPRFPQSVYQLHEFIMRLAESLLGELDQERVTVVMPDTSVMLEREDADQSRVHEE